MSTKIRAIVLMAVVAVFASVMVAPASAMTNGVGAFTGSASVGKWFRTVCDKSGVGIPTGRGLYAPGTVTVAGVSNGDDTREENGVWQISVAGQLSAGQNQGGLAVGPFSLHACGYLSPVVDNADPTVGDRFDGIGASCGSSKGHHGQGNVVFANGERIKLYNLGWKASAGGTLPVTGSYQEYADDLGNPNQADKKEKRGTVLAEVQAQGAAPCSGLKDEATNNGNGAQTFTVGGVTELINGAPAPEKEEAKNCKNPGSAADGAPGGKKSHGNKPGVKACDDRLHGGEKETP